jgi:hypothetical protein
VKIRARRGFATEQASKSNLSEVDPIAIDHALFCKDGFVGRANVNGSVRVEAKDKGTRKMSHVTYEVVEHDGGWAYKVGDVFSESFASKKLALAAARRAALEQRAPGESGIITYEDKSGHWRDEDAKGTDRPDTEVKG